MSAIDCKEKLVSILLLFSSSISGFAANGHMYVSASLGNSFAKLSNSNPQITYDNNLLTDAYPLNSNRDSTPIISLNTGYEFAGANLRPAVALGLGIYSEIEDYIYKGQLIETASGDPSSTLFDYSYNLNSTRIMAEIQLTWMLGKLAPFINFGAGPVWNRMSGYTEIPVSSTGYSALPAFQAQTNTNFAYQMGLGVSTSFNFDGSHADFPAERISVGYRYANLGTTSFGTRGANYPYKLSTGRLNTNDVYLSYTHFFKE